MSELSVLYGALLVGTVYAIFIALFFIPALFGELGTVFSDDIYRCMQWPRFHVVAFARHVHKWFVRRREYRKKASSVLKKHGSSIVVGRYGGELRASNEP